MKLASSPPPAPSRRQRAFPRVALFFSLGLGVLAGLGGYTLSYAKGLSYLSTDPAACVNCHIMQREYDAWQKASHHAVAVCVDCHLPHDFVPKYLAKAENGWRHGKLFTTGGFEEPITVKASGLRILQENCVQCHAAATAEMQAHDAGGVAPGTAAASETAATCLHCHRTVGHGPVAGLGGPLTPAEREASEH